MWKASGHIKDYEPMMSSDSRSNRLNFINTPEELRNYVVYPMSKDAVKYIEAINLNQTDQPAKNFSSQILAEEMEGYNLIASIIPEDIFTTVKAIQTSFNEPIQLQSKNTAESYGLRNGQNNIFDSFIESFESAFGIYTLLEY